MSRIPFEILREHEGFRPDPRFAAASQSEPEPEPDTQASDPLALAWEAGHTAGRAQAEAETAERDQHDGAARAAIELALARLDEEQTERLRLWLYATVEALCEASLAPLALDREALVARVERAAAMLARADDDKVLRLHPLDLPLIEDRLPAGLTLVPDPALERGALRIETAQGGVEDGPAHWRRAIAEAIAQC